MDYAVQDVEVLENLVQAETDQELQKLDFTLFPNISRIRFRCVITN